MFITSNQSSLLPIFKPNIKANKFFWWKWQKISQQDKNNKGLAKLRGCPIFTWASL
jgi:hypothetical protein